MNCPICNWRPKQNTKQSRLEHVRLEHPEYYKIYLTKGMIGESLSFGAKQYNNETH